LSSSDLNASPKIGFIEVVCKPEVSLQQMATRRFKESFARMPRDEQQVMTDNMNAAGIRELVFGVKHPNNIGGKKRRKTRKGSRKRSKMTRRRK
jgi:hypothetical protein